MQVNQNVNAANFLLVSSQANNVSVVKEMSSDSVDFASALQSANDNRQYQNATNPMPDKTSKMDSKDTSLVRESVDKKEETSTIDDTKVENNNDSTHASETEKSVKTDDKDVKETETTSQTEETDVTEVAKMENLEDVEMLSDEELAVLLETVGNLLQDVMNQFDLTAEELTVQLEEFDMQPTDLLTKDGLKEFFLKMNNADVSDLVVNEELNMQLQSFMEEISPELNLLQNVSSEFEKVIANMDVTTLTQGAVMETTSKDTEQMPVLVNNDEEGVSSGKMEDEFVISDEPEVIVSDNRNQNNDAKSELNQQQSKNNKVQQPVSTESTIVDNKSLDHNTFENPILQAIQNAVDNVETTIMSEQPVQQTDVVRQLVEQVRLNMNQQQTSLELQLYPEHLGRIQINVVSKEGVMTASIVAETEAAKQAIEAGLLNLKEAMEQQELKVEAIEVMVSTMGFEQGDEQQKSFDEKGSSNPRRKIDLSELGEEIPVEDEAEVEKMKASGSSVSYRA